MIYIGLCSLHCNRPSIFIIHINDDFRCHRVNIDIGKNVGAQSDLTIFTEVVDGVEAQSQSGRWYETQADENAFVGGDYTITDQNRRCDS